eukprot:m.114714 g.114714  ORF g.114714 m.114714 type:complete len:459 (-) comp14430_c1_seq2:72-1448(-)
MMGGAGFLEGALTSVLIDEAIANYAMDTSNKTLMNDLRTWFGQWGQWMRALAREKVNDPYRIHLGLIFNQLDGLVSGHNAACHAPCTPLDIVDVLLLSPSVMDIITVISGSSPEWTTMPLDEALLLSARTTHCSGLVRRSPEGDVFFGHTTWNMYTGMVRIFKSYALPLAAPQTRAVTITFSSYPGALYSGDDFLQMRESGLAVIETTNDIFDNSLYKNLSPQGTVITWIRSILASRMAATANEWTALFEKYNSGTYNNQYIVVDYNLVEVSRGRPLPPNTVWIVEQLPNYTRSGDVTAFLNRPGKQFWPSYNIPFFQDIYNMSGYPAMAARSDQYSYTECARAKIFERDAPLVNELDEMLRLMQSNDYRNDPLSLGSPANAISSRFDLTTTQPFTVGGIDSKITSSKLLRENAVYAISGPTHQSLPPFEWTGPWAQFPHEGMPLLFNFNYTLIQFYV